MNMLLAVVALLSLGMPARLPTTSTRTPTQDALVYGEAEGETLTMDYYAPRGQGTHPAAIIIHGGGYQRGVRCDIIRIPGGKHGTSNSHTLPRVPPWEREMVEWLNARFDRTGPIGDGIRQREPQ